MQALASAVLCPAASSSPLRQTPHLALPPLPAPPIPAHSLSPGAMRVPCASAASAAAAATSSLVLRAYSSAPAASAAGVASALGQRSCRSPAVSRPALLRIPLAAAGTPTAHPQRTFPQHLPSSPFRAACIPLTWSQSAALGQGSLALTDAVRVQAAGTRTAMSTGAEGGTGEKQPQRGAKGGKRGKEGEEAGGQYKGTLNLPSTGFGMRANSTQREVEIQNKWEEHRVAQGLHDSNPGEVFTLHDGPPYANGDLHIGHALNKILKDIINRYQILRGRKVRYIPGWDCHGLPIELKVLQSMDSKARQGLTPLKLRKKAAQFALKTVDKQRESFKRYGVWGEWDAPYLTLQPEYEAAQVGVFGAMFLQGHIYRGRKPVHWSPSSRTALAEAELEYPEGHASRSMYARFPLSFLAPGLASALPEGVGQGNLGVAIWTTTPWTMPGNAAVAVNDRLEYVVVRVSPTAAEGEGAQPVSGAEAPAQSKGEEEKPKEGAAAAAAAPSGPRFGKGNRNPGQALRALTGGEGPGAVGEYLVVARDLVEKLEEKLKARLEVLATVRGSELQGSKYSHPVFPGVECPVVVGGEYITTESGTGLVHTAPGHGQEDYATGLKYGLPLLSPVDDAGRFTAEAGADFQGLDVLGEGNTAVMAALDGAGVLLLEERYEHKYPYDWRTKKPTIFRATDQWFASVRGFREAALEGIRGVSWVPPQGEKRITAMTEDRSDWCISRQRAWGVPIPVFYHKETGEPLLTQETLSHIQEVFRQKGSDAWYELEVGDLLPEGLRGQAEEYERGTDTMDVWFDSGSSWAAVLQQREGLRCPADLYLEGSDQHRGWFQSSLLTGIAAQGQAPYKQVLTHGFVLDEKGLKMSKSLGNVVDPSTVIVGGKNQKTEPAYGADVLRLWVSSVDYSSDVVIGPAILRQMADVYRKLRGTLRFMLGNLDGFDPSRDLVPYEALPNLDKYALFRLGSVMEEVQRSYNDFQFFKFSQLIQRFAVVDLSNFYFDVCKDRLYVGGRTSPTRRACQTVLYHHVLCMLGAIAPVLPHMAEDGWENLPFPVPLPAREGEEGAVPAASVFQALWPQVPQGWSTLPSEETRRWATLLQVRGEVNKVMELARGGKLIGANLDAKVYLHSSNPGLQSLLFELADDGGQLKSGEDNAVDTLRAILLCSQARMVASMEEAVSLGLEYSSRVPIALGGAPEAGDNGSGNGGLHSADSEASTSDSSSELWIGVGRADGGKCERCWNFSASVGATDKHPTLCDRCAAVVVDMPVAEVPAMV